MRRIKIFALLMVAALWALWALSAHAANYAISAGASGATIQSTINSAAAAGGGNTVTFAAGMYSISTPISIPCPASALTITGPVVAYPIGMATAQWPGPYTAILNSSAVTWALSLSGNCSTAVTIQYLGYNGGEPAAGGGGFLYVAAATSNLTVQYNYLAGNQANVNTGHNYDSMIFFDGTNTDPSSRYDVNDTISWNVIGHSNDGTWTNADCGAISQLFVYQGSSYDAIGGQCAGVAVLSSTTNLTVSHNVIHYQEEGVKMIEGGSQASQFFYQTNFNFTYNDVSFIHRIVLENQQTPQPANYLNNSIHDGVYNAYGSWIFSNANAPTDNVNNNVNLNNLLGPPGNSSTGPGFCECWGNGTSNNNLIQGNQGSVFQWGYAGPMQIMNNIMQNVCPGCNPSFINNAHDLPGSAAPATGNNVETTTLSTLTSHLPTISPNAGPFSGTMNVTLADTGDTSNLGPQGNTSIWYTTDGSNPVPGTGTARFYTAPFAISTSTTVKAVGMWGALNQPTSYPSGYGFVPSAVVSAVYTSSGGGGGGGPVTWNAKTNWGATGNGATNDGPAIQAGVAKISAGDTVYFPAGTYLINNVVTFSVGAIITCQAGAILQGPNLGTDVFSIVSNTTVGGSATTGCIFSGGGIQASGSGGDNSQTLSQAISNLSFTYNTFENMTYATNTFRTNGGIFLGGGANNVVIRRNTFSNINPYSDGYNSAGSTTLAQYDPDGSSPRAAIWFYGASNLTIDHNTFSHDYQNISGCQAQSFQASNIAIHHNYSNAHHRMFLQLNTGSGCGNSEYNAGIAGFAVYANYDFDAGGPYAYSNSYGFSAPFSTAGGVTIPMSGVNWYNNLLKGQVLDTASVGIGMEVGAQNMNIYNNTVMGQWPCAGCGYGGASGGYIQNSYACLDQPSVSTAPMYGDEGNGSTTVTYQGNVLVANCPAGNASLAVSLSPVSNSSGTLSATATVSTVEYGMQGVVFAIDGAYVSAVTGAGPYTLNYSASGLVSGSHTVSATVVDAVGVAAVSNSQTVSTASGVGPGGGPIAPNVLPVSVVWDVAGNAPDPINGASSVGLSSVYLSTPGSATTILVGASLQFTANCVYSDGSTTSCNNSDSHGNAVTAWSSTNTPVLAVSSAGVATGTAAGTATIQATVTGGIMSAPLTITVNNAALTLSAVALSTAGNVTTITAGTSNQLAATCRYSDGSSTSCNSVDAHGNAVASYSSTSPASATVNAGGLVSGVAAGSANFSATVIPAPSQLGTNAYDSAGVTYAGFINMDYGVTGTAAGQYTPGTCYITLPGIPTAGAHWDCILTLAPTPTTQATAALCSNRYTTTGNEGANPTIAISMASCAKLGPDTAFWLGSTADGSGAVPQGFTACGTGCMGAAPVYGSGTYAYAFVANPFGSYSGMATALNRTVNLQVSQYLTLTTTAVTSPSLALTVAASPATLTLVTLSATGGATSLVVGGTLQISATCHYSDGSSTSCQVADIHGNGVTAWTSSDVTKATIGAVGTANPGLVTAVSAGAVTIQATVGSVHSSTDALTVNAPVISLSNVTLASTGGVTSLGLTTSNQLLATCIYSDGTMTSCNMTDAHGNGVSAWNSSDPTLATVSSSGLVTAVAVGAPTFTATVNGDTSAAFPLTTSLLPPGTYTITITGPVTITGTVQF